MVALSRTPDLLERVIAGEQVTDRRVADLVLTVRALGAVDIGCHPDPAFVAALGARLLAEAEALQVDQVGPADQVTDSGAPAIRGSSPRTTIGARPRGGPHPVIIFVGHGWPRLLAGVTASLIAVASIVGVASRSALPGQALYPVKQVLDTAAVTLAGSDLDKGQTLLGQAEGHVVDAAQLVDGPPPVADDVTTALTAAIDTTTRGQVLLQQAYAHDHQLQALGVLRDFSTRLIPQVDALSGRVPPGSVASLQRLRALLGGVSAGASSTLAGLPGTAAGPPGASASGDPKALVVTANPAATAAQPGRTVSGNPPSAPAIPGRPGLPGVPGVPGVHGSSGAEGAGGSVGTVGSQGEQGAPAGVGVGLPHGGAGSVGVGVGSNSAGAGVTLPRVTATVGVPGATVGTGGGVGVGLPSATLSLPLPGVTVGGSSIGVGGGGVGVGLPSATLSLPLPGVTVGVGTARGGGSGAGGPSTCILIVCLP